MSAPTVSLKTYALTWGGLLCLTLITTLIAMVDLGSFTMLIAIAIATLKAGLIAAFFMHALFEAKLVKVAIAGAVIWLLIMVTLTLADYMSRGWTPVPGR
jgi:cytochrome c oxidase subunit 4